ncbi:hypothetical protein EPIR_0794 [Erwinia piriflorinigrans CFBP 5888]|uniref:Uncharacterized protein n=1 Tax=Erwinia piriflorinigrans CFBP 5888 TaxID=1161919 RepID=V5Z5A9_9GAMM|nr:hypothetical protein EPIR_0794 [Erwinia piriflorinigrans CFBP 5888]
MDEDQAEITLLSWQSAKSALCWIMSVFSYYAQITAPYRLF